MESFFFVFFHAFQNQKGKLFRYLVVEFPRVFRFFCLMLEDNAYWRFSFERNSPGQHLVQDCSQRVNIGPLVYLFPLHLFRRHVFWRPDDHSVRCQAFSFDCTGNPKIHDASISITVYHNVLGL